MFGFPLAFIRNVLADRKGVTALEYGVIAGGIVVAVGTAAALLGPQIATLFGKFGTALT
jgi:pilus assembly protein Flp/PilA